MKKVIAGMLIGLCANSSYASDPVQDPFRTQVHDTMIQNTFGGKWKSECKILSSGTDSVRQWWTIEKSSIVIVEASYTDDNCLALSGLSNHSYSYNSQGLEFDEMGERQYPIRLTTKIQQSVRYLSLTDGGMRIKPKLDGHEYDFFTQTGESDE
jgi:hypothetical protein